MEKINLTKIFTYPLKSAKGILLEKAPVERLGFPFDRNFAIIDLDNKIITARENTELLKIQTKIEGQQLEFSSPVQSSIIFSLNELPTTKSISVGIFKNFTSAIPIEHPINDWLSEFLNQPVRLVKIDPNSPRNMKAKHNGKEGDTIPFCDAAPLHLISEASLAYLNSHLENPVTITNFRPNLVIKGCQAFEEDQWSRVEIGNCSFEVAVKTIRCNLITIHPETTERNKNQEPLRTLSKLKKSGNEVTFGIYLIPRKLGVVRQGDAVIGY